MSLPKIQYPILTLDVPSTKQRVNFRPFLVKEEKILLMAKASGDETDIFAAIKQIVNNCALDEKFDVNKISLFDMEYLFLKIRAASVENTVNVTYKDFEDEKNYDFEVDLNEVKMVFPENISNTIKINETTGLLMKYPSASLYDDKEFLEAGDAAFFKMIARCVDKIYVGDEMYDSATQSKKDIEEFIEQLDVKSFEKIRQFMVNQPYMSYTINYKNSLNNDRKIEMRSLSDFFTLR